MRRFLELLRVDLLEVSAWALCPEQILTVD